MSLVELQYAYSNNNKFKEYVNKYARKHRMLPEDCLSHSVVQNVYLDLYKEA